ncbi:SAPS-domain-containing protein [Sistotremastrum suecicum HHB10207 ss-3]|uniref:SAPS-domain-containing protein n=1 Tax=Sistotremastrum suecicum HHB10207 ss-3 TaxID=1314776 RepID=A0A166E6P5_9AGAM|nr:SAPS-domain-containing protein [Sistotremastrum suecicum HHB10207 ss-3]
MFWRFGFQNASSIDALLDKEDVTVEAILDEDDLIQECKNQNPRLMDFLRRADVLQRLLRYVTGEIEGEERDRFKYPFVATEVLCSDMWSIVETCLEDPDHLLRPFWDAVLDRSAEEMQTRASMAAHFTKINFCFMSKKPVEMFVFIRDQPLVLERILAHIESTPFVDLLVRIIQLDENPTVTGVLEWLSSERLVPRLIDFLSPIQSPDIHVVAADLIKIIITMSAPSPGQSALSEGLQNGPASNRFAREVASLESITKLVGHMLDDAPSASPMTTDVWTSGQDSYSLSDSVISSTTEQATSSAVNSISILIELIRKNNSDYFEPFLFHTLRNRLIQVQQHIHLQSDEPRQVLERSMAEMVERMGVVHLGTLLEYICGKLCGFQRLLLNPRSESAVISTTFGTIRPLTFERLRICELYAELLHCSNMSLLNRPPGIGPKYDESGRLQGGLAALEELAQVITTSSGNTAEPDRSSESVNEIEPSKELPISGLQGRTASTSSPFLSDSDDSLSGDGSDDGMEDIDVDGSESDRAKVMSLETSGHPSVVTLPDSISGDADSPHTPSETSTVHPPVSSGIDSPLGSEADVEMAKNPTLSSGDRLKDTFLQMNIISTLLDLFFEFPWNNLLHTIVYDVIHQVLTGQLDPGLNRELIVGLFRDARLLYRILEAQRLNDLESTKPKGLRLGFMGHITLISEDIVSALEHCPAELSERLQGYIPQPEWTEYVQGRYLETKRKDAALLGGGKPAVSSSVIRGEASVAQWGKIDEDDTVSSKKVTPLAPPPVGNGSLNGELRRNGRLKRESTADFGQPTMADLRETSQFDEESNTPSAQHFVNYLAAEMSSTMDRFGSAGDDTSDDEDEESGWLSQSQFDLSVSPLSRGIGTESQSLSRSFGDSFNPLTNHSSLEDAFNADSDEDDSGFGPFSDSAAAHDPFNFSNEFATAEGPESPFDDFGGFGDFQAAEETDLASSGDSWAWENSESGRKAGSDEVEEGMSLAASSRTDRSSRHDES